MNGLEGQVQKERGVRYTTCMGGKRPQRLLREQMLKTIEGGCQKTTFLKMLSSTTNAQWNTRRSAKNPARSRHPPRGRGPARVALTLKWGRKGL